MFRDYTEEGIKDSIAEWGIVVSLNGIWLFNNNIGKGQSYFQSKKIVLEIIYGKNSDQYYFDFLSYNNILGIEPNTYFFKDIAEYRNCYYKGSEKSWPAYSSALKRFLKYCCSIDIGKWYLKSETNNVYDTIELTDFYSYIEKKTKLEKENTLKNVFFYIKDFMCCMSEKSAFDISTKTMLDGFSKILKQDERQNVINLEKLKLEEKEIRMPGELIKALQRLKALGVSGDYVFYRTKDNGEEPIREDVINDVFSKLTRIDPNDEYYKALTPANIRASLVRYLFEQGESLEKIIYLMNIEIWNLGNYISLKDIEYIVEQRKKKENHPMEEFFEKLK